MVVDDVDVGCAVGRPAESDAPLLVDANGVETAHPTGLVRVWFVKKSSTTRLLKL